MLRMFYVETQSAQGETQVESERAGCSLSPIAGFEVLSERSVAEPRQTIVAVGLTLEIAKAEMQRIFPPGAGTIAERILAEPDRHAFVVSAGDEEDAKEQARELFGQVSIRRLADGEPADVSLVDIVSVATRDRGRKGFLGLGRRLATYDVVIEHKACVERSYFPGWRFVRRLGIPIHSVEALQRCASNDILSPEADFEEATNRLRAEGTIGSLALAKLIDTCRECRSAAILWAVRAARDAEPTRPLIEALEASLGTPQKVRLGDGERWLTPELIEVSGVGHIAWSDRTYTRLKSFAEESLDALKQKLPANGGATLPGSVVILCAMCNEPASISLSDAALCETHFQARLGRIMRTE